MMQSPIQQSFSNIEQEAKRVQAIRIDQYNRERQTIIATVDSSAVSRIPFHILEWEYYRDMFKAASDDGRQIAYAVTDEHVIINVINKHDGYALSLTAYNLPIELFNQSEEFIRDYVSKEIAEKIKQYAS